MKSIYEMVQGILIKSTLGIPLFISALNINFTGGNPDANPYD